MAQRQKTWRHAELQKFADWAADTKFAKYSVNGSAR
jgi:hypothetical protein